VSIAVSATITFVGRVSRKPSQEDIETISPEKTRIFRINLFISIVVY